MAAPPKPSPQQLRKAYADICRGYSVGQLDRKSFVIKHLTAFEYGEADDYQQEQLAKAKAKGIPTREQKSEWLIKNGLWSKKQDTEIKEQADYLENKELTRSKLAFKSQADALAKELAEERKAFAALVEKREKLFDLTAEKVAWNKAQFYYIYLAIYRDESLSKRLYSQRDLDEWDDDESFKLLDFYFAHLELLSLENVKRIAVSPVFLNHFEVCGDNLWAFFNRPVWQMTVPQTNLITNGAYFRNLLRSEQFIPEDIRDDPQKIEDFVKQSAARKEILSRASKNGGQVTLFGQKSDIEAMGGQVDHSFLDKGPQSLASQMM